MVLLTIKQNNDSCLFNYKNVTIYITDFFSVMQKEQIVTAKLIIFNQNSNRIPSSRTTKGAHQCVENILIFLIA